MSGTTKIVEVCPWCGDPSKDGEFCRLCVASAANPNNDICEENPPAKERYAPSSWNHPEGGRAVNFDLACRRAGIQQYIPSPEELQPAVEALTKRIDEIVLARVKAKLHEQKGKGTSPDSDGRQPGAGESG